MRRISHAAPADRFRCVVYALLHCTVRARQQETLGILSVVLKSYCDANLQQPSVGNSVGFCMPLIAEHDFFIQLFIDPQNRA